MKAALWRLIHKWRDATTTEAAWIARDQIDIELDKIEAAATQEPVEQRDEIHNLNAYSMHERSLGAESNAQELHDLRQELAHKNVIDEMQGIADQYAHLMAWHLESVLSDYNGRYWDDAMNVLGGYRSAMNAIHEIDSPTHMGEPLIPKEPT